MRNSDRTKKKGQNSYSTSLLKALNVLDQFVDGEELGIKELSERTGNPPSTIQRMVNTFVMCRYLEQDPDSLKYNLGTALYHLTGAVANNRRWIEQAEPLMRDLVKQHGETVNLAALQDNHVVYLTKVDSPQVLRPSFTVGAPYPVLTTSLGRCLMAYQPDDSALEILRANGVPEEEIPKYESMFREIRSNGYAMEDEQFQIGLFCVAAPVFGKDGETIAAISMTIPKARLRFNDLPEIIRHTKETAAKISELTNN